MKQLALGNDVRAPIIRVVMVRTVVTPGNSGGLITLNARKGRQMVHGSIKHIHEKKLSVCLSVCKDVTPGIKPTDTDASWDGGQWDPEGNPGQDDQQAGGDVGLQDEVQDAPLQFKVEDKLWVIALKKTVG